MINYTQLITLLHVFPQKNTFHLVVVVLASLTTCCYCWCSDTLTLSHVYYFMVMESSSSCCSCCCCFWFRVKMKDGRIVIQFAFLAGREIILFCQKKTISERTMMKNDHIVYSFWSIWKRERDQSSVVQRDLVKGSHIW